MAHLVQVEVPSKEPVDDTELPPRLASRFCKNVCTVWVCVPEVELVPEPPLADCMADRKLEKSDCNLLSVELPEASLDEVDELLLVLPSELIKLCSPVLKLPY